MFIVDLVKNLLKDSLHGGFLKAMALIARVGFLIYVLPRLPSGELTTYVYINSVALLVATFGIFGLNDELPRSIGGDRQVANRYSALFIATNLLACASLTILLGYSSVIWAIVAYAISVLSSRLLGGLIRSFDPALNEQLQNLPWVLFLPLVLVLKPDSALGLVATMVVSHLVVQWYCVARAIRLSDAAPTSATESLIRMLRQNIRHGIGKQASNLCLLGLMRSPVLWPVWFSMEIDLDGIAFAVAVGEVVSQFGLIPVNRAYSRWCRTLPTQAKEWRRAVFAGLTWWGMLAVLGCTGVLIAGAFGLLPLYQDIEVLLLQAVLLYSFIPAFRLLRYLLWARALLVMPVFLVSATLFLAAGLVISSTSLSEWFLLLLLECLIGWVILCALSKRNFPAGVGQQS